MGARDPISWRVKITMYLLTATHACGDAFSGKNTTVENFISKQNSSVDANNMHCYTSIVIISILISRIAIEFIWKKVFVHMLFRPTTHLRLKRGRWPLERCHRHVASLAKTVVHNFVLLTSKMEGSRIVLEKQDAIDEFYTFLRASRYDRWPVECQRNRTR